MTETQRAAMQQALEALEQLQGGCTDSDDGTVEAITVWCPEVIEALRAALAEPEPPIWQTLAEIGASAPAGTWDAPVATPPARQPLTDDQIKAAVMDDPFFGAALMSMMRDNAMVSDVRQAIVGIFRAAERAHGIEEAK